MLLSILLFALWYDDVIYLGNRKAFLNQSCPTWWISIFLSQDISFIFGPNQLLFIPSQFFPAQYLCLSSLHHNKCFALHRSTHSWNIHPLLLSRMPTSQEFHWYSFLSAMHTHPTATQQLICICFPETLPLLHLEKDSILSGVEGRKSKWPPSHGWRLQAGAS